MVNFARIGKLSCRINITLRGILSLDGGAELDCSTSAVTELRLYPFILLERLL